MDYEDKFERPYSEEVGPPWVESESTPGAIILTGSRLRFTMSASAGWLYYDAPYGPDQRSRVLFAFGEAEGVGAVVRGSGPWTAFTGYAAYRQYGGPSLYRVRIRRFEGYNLAFGAGLTRVVKDIWIPRPMQPLPIELRAVGQTLRVLEGDALVLEAQDAVIADGRAGAMGADAIAQVPIAEIDEWAGGDAA